MIFGAPLSQLPQELFGSDVIVEGQLNKVLPVSGTSAGKEWASASFGLNFYVDNLVHVVLPVSDMCGVLYSNVSSMKGP